MNITQELLGILDEILSLNGRTAHFDSSTPLLGAIPELDSMAVVAIITALEDRFGFTVGDDELDGTTFATVGSLSHFVSEKFTASNVQ